MCLREFGEDYGKITKCIEEFQEEIKKYQNTALESEDLADYGTNRKAGRENLKITKSISVLQDEWQPKVDEYDSKISEYENRIAQLEAKLALVNKLQRDINNLDTRLTTVERQDPPNITGGGSGIEVLTGTLGDGNVNANISYAYQSQNRFYYNFSLDIKGCKVYLSKKLVYEDLSWNFGGASYRIYPITLTSYTQCPDFDILNLTIRYNGKSYTRLSNPRKYTYELQIAYK